MRAARRAGRPLARTAVPSRTTRHERQDGHVVRADAEQRVAQQPRDRDGPGEAAGHAHQHDADAAGDDAAEDVRGPRAERDADADLARALRHEIHRHAVGAADRQHERERREHGEHPRERRAQRHRLADRVLHGSQPEERDLRIHLAQQLADRRRHRQRIAGRVDRHHHVRRADRGRSGNRGRGASDARGRSASRRRRRRRPSSTERSSPRYLIRRPDAVGAFTPEGAHEGFVHDDRRRAAFGRLSAASRKRPPFKRIPMAPK